MIILFSFVTKKNILINISKMNTEKVNFIWDTIYVQMEYFKFIFNPLMIPREFSYRYFNFLPHL